MKLMNCIISVLSLLLVGLTSVNAESIKNPKKKRETTERLNQKT